MDPHDSIRVTGAHENNLKSVNVQIPKRALTVFTGVSGSGKSSLVFDTIGAESQRMINETYPAFVQGFMPTLARPRVDRLEGITPAITVDQERLGANIRSTVGTVTDANTLLRILFSTLAEPKIGSPQAYAFNIPSVTGAGAVTVQRGEKTMAEKRTYSVVGGMCPRCEGTGSVSDIDLTAVYDPALSLLAGAILIPGYTADGWAVRQYAESGLFDPTVPISRYSKRQLHDLLYKEPTKIKISGINMTYEGLIPRITKSMLSKDVDSLQPHLQRFVERAVTFQICPECSGSRLAEGARNSFIDGVSIADACDMQVEDCAAWVRTIDAPQAEPIITALLEVLDSFIAIGLGYLSLNRSSGTLSGGEAQRTKMIRHLNSALTDVTYIFDEPTAGLHPADVTRMNDLLRSLRDKGNTVLVVEHEPETIKIADWIVDMGPGAGRDGGEVTYVGDVAGLATSGTLTGEFLNMGGSLTSRGRTPSGAIQVRGASLNNLHDVDVDIPRGVLTVLTGVAGSGKSSLTQCIDAEMVRIDQSAIKGSRRSNPATYTGLLEPIRKAFAKAHGVKPALFSFNSDGACPVCKGNGIIITELGFMDVVVTPCEECGGRRFKSDVLEYKISGANIADVLEMTCSHALDFFADQKLSAAVKILKRLVDVGLGYMTLGQPLSSLSGGERQRLKLATHLTEAADVYVMDEPTNGLHPADVDALLELLDAIVDAGTSVIVVEHNLDVVAHADWVIDMGPGAGHDGGRVVFEGTPGELAESGTATGTFLAKHIA